MVLAIGLTALTLSFGPTLPFYDWLYWLFPPLKMIRGVVRFGQIVLAAVAILAGFGLAWLTTRFRGRAVAVMAILLVIAANGEALRAPFGYTRYEVFRSVRRAAHHRRRYGRGLVPVLPDGIVPLQHDVHAWLDAVLEADRERLFGVQAAEPVCQRRTASGIPRRSLDGSPRGARRHSCRG